MNAFTIAQTILGILLIVTILLQQRGAGLSGTFGGEGNTYSTRRGAEKFIFASTIVCAILWIGVSVARLLF